MTYENFVTTITQAYDQYTVSKSGISEDSEISKPRMLIMVEACKRLYKLRMETEHHIWIKENNFRNCWNRLDAITPPLGHNAIQLELNARYTNAQKAELAALVANVNTLRRTKKHLEDILASPVIPRGLAEQERELAKVGEMRIKLLNDALLCTKQLHQFLDAKSRKG